jgi:hypothetical protein
MIINDYSDGIFEPYDINLGAYGEITRGDKHMFYAPFAFVYMRHGRTGQNNVDRSCSVIWSAVGVVCPAWSPGGDKVCSSQYFDSLFAYSSLGCFDMLSSGRSVFHCSS